MTNTLGTTEARLGEAAYDNGWRCVTGAVDDWMIVFYRDPERVSVEFDNLGRIARASHWTGKRWAPVTGVDKVGSVIFILSTEQ